MTVQIRVDRELCMGSAQCSIYAAGTFDQDDDGIVVVVDPEGDPPAKIRNAARGCPTGAISVDDV